MTHQPPMWAIAVGAWQGLLRMTPHFALLFGLFTVLTFGSRPRARTRSLRRCLDVMLHGALTTIWAGAVALSCGAAGWSGEAALAITVTQVAIVVGWRLATGRSPAPWSNQLNSRQRLALRHGHAIALLSILIGLGDLVVPHRLWHPFALLSYYSPTTTAGLAAASSACPLTLGGFRHSNGTQLTPLFDPSLCLSPQQWSILSGGTLSPAVAEHTAAVREGIQRAAPGVVINVVARDVEDSVPALIQNVQMMCLLLPRIAVVIFENDSADHTRASTGGRFAAWRDSYSRSGCEIHLLECDEAPDCRLGDADRWDKVAYRWDPLQPINARLAAHRNRALNAVLDRCVELMSDRRFSEFASGRFSTYAFMLVVDVDLEANWSPLGLLHSLGKSPQHPVASRGVMAWPGAMGTLPIMYDFAAFRAVPSSTNWWLLYLHRCFCSLPPAVSQMYAQCDAMSPFQLFGQLGLISAAEWGSRGQPYPVLSAYNGAMIYPIPLLLANRSTARYSAGEGAECEHVELSRAFGAGGVFVNPLWTMKIPLGKRAGPQGVRALRMLLVSFFQPSWVMMGTTMSSLCIVSHAAVVMAVHFVRAQSINVLTSGFYGSIGMTHAAHNNDRRNPI